MSEPYFSEEEKIKQGHAAFKSFFDDLGPNDIYKRILLETFFEFIYKNSNEVPQFLDNYDLSLSDEEGQEGREAGDAPPGDVPHADEDNGPDRP